MKVAVLGSGPAGLLATHACKLHGHEVTVYSKKEPSPMGGAQYLHRDIPGVSGLRKGMITYLKMGTSMGYASKVYGDRNAPTSWEHFKDGEHGAYSLKDLYTRLWQFYSGIIRHGTLYPDNIEMLCAAYDLVFSTIPAERLCEDWDRHKFNSREIALIRQPVLRANNTVLYSGRPEDKWYRTSVIFGQPWTEFPIDAVDRYVADVAYGIKPLDTDCTCHIGTHPNFFRLGRFGQWKKGVLTHHAYEMAEEILEDLA